MSALSPSATADSDAAAAQALVRGLEGLNVRLRIPRLHEHPRMEAGQFSQVLGKMAAAALASGGPQNNPVIPTADQIVEPYQSAW